MFGRKGGAGGEYRRKSGTKKETVFEVDQKDRVQK